MSLETRLASLITAIGADIKAVKPAVTTVASSATPTPTGYSAHNQLNVTALAAAATFAAPSGTPVDGNSLII